MIRLNRVIPIFFLLLGMATGLSAQDHALKPRLVVCTDIAPADVEPDDMESMVHLMAYADMLEIEAIITSVGWNCDPYPTEWAQYLQQVIDAYAQDVVNLKKRSEQTGFLSTEEENGCQKIGYWPSAAYLRSRAVMGSLNGGIRSVGEGNDSPGSDLLIRLADEDDPRPIYVAAWGGANTLAQAIWRVGQTRSAEELKRFVSKFRLYTITDQDMDFGHRMDRARSSHMWLRQEFKDDLRFIWDEGTWQEQCDLGKRHWTHHQNNIQSVGALGKVYPNYKWGVEGDTPSFLYALPNGLNDPEDPRQCGWAGYHEYGLCPDSLTTAWTSWQEPVNSISIGYKRRFYQDELADFEARMQWTDGNGNHNRNPIAVVNGHHGPSSLTLNIKAGDELILDASRSSDPDGDDITFYWWQQPEIGQARLAITDDRQSIITIKIPDDSAGQSLHLICEVSDNGFLHLKSYQRIILNCVGKEVAEPLADNNLFVSLLGKSQAEVDARIDSVWNHFFTSGDLSRYEDDNEKTVYYEVGDSMAIILDTGNNDVRTEGMSYGMMISLQLDKRHEFDKLWRWVKTYMAYPENSSWDGYFCWQCGLDGTQIGNSNASDGEIYFVTALFMAADKWGEPRYAEEANEILRKISSKDGPQTGVYNLFDDSTQLVTFVPNEEVHWYSDPSYCLPAFLELWAEKADNNNDFWRTAANKARWLLKASQDSITGLFPDYCLFDGKPYRRPNFDYHTDRYQYDAIRCAMNVGMDYYLTGKVAEQQRLMMRRLLQFFKTDGFNGGQFNLDGSEPTGSYTEGMAGANAVGAFALADSDNEDDLALAREYVQRLWDVQPPKGKWRYYVGMVYFLSMLHVSGNFSL